MSLIMYLVAFCMGSFGIWSLQSGLRSKSANQKMHEAASPRQHWINSKEKSIRIYIGIVMLILSLVIFFRQN
jgi:hypothetical protein